MEKYYICETGHDMHDSATAWVPCKSTTLIGAKREATRELGGGYQHHAIFIGVKVDDYPIQDVACRSLSRSGKWQDIN